MEVWLQNLITIVCAVIASSGFWAFIQKKLDRKDDRTKLLVGIAHDRICWLGASYIKRKYITPDEYENLYDYLYVPYHNCGGNGTAEKVIEEVKRLPMHPPTEK